MLIIEKEIELKYDYQLSEVDNDRFFHDPVDKCAERSTWSQIFL